MLLLRSRAAYRKRYTSSQQATVPYNPLQGSVPQTDGWYRSLLERRSSQLFLPDALPTEEPLTMTVPFEPDSLAAQVMPPCSNLRSDIIDYHVSVWHLTAHLCSGQQSGEPYAAFVLHSVSHAAQLVWHASPCFAAGRADL